MLAFIVFRTLAVSCVVIATAIAVAFPGVSQAYGTIAVASAILALVFKK